MTRRCYSVKPLLTDVSRLGSGRSPGLGNSFPSAGDRARVKGGGSAARPRQSQVIML